MALSLDAVESIVETAILSSVNLFGHSIVKEAQNKAITQLLKGNDVFVSLPTGYGKSLVYQILPFCVARILETVSQPPAQDLVPCVLVLSPLTALMSDQFEKAVDFIIYS